MIGAIGSALQGLFTQKQRVNEAAQQIAEFPVNVQQASEALSSPSLIENSDFQDIDLGLDRAIVDLLDASNLYKANLAVIETASELEDELLDILV